MHPTSSSWFIMKKEPKLLGAGLLQDDLRIVYKKARVSYRTNINLRTKVHTHMTTKHKSLLDDLQVEKSKKHKN